MTYYINLGGILVHRIKSVSDDGEREITSYDGIGQGFFPVPESRRLRTWTIECGMTGKDLNGLPNWPAVSEVFTAFEVLLAVKDPSCFIFVSDSRSESMSDYLTGYSKREEYPGVYSVMIKMTKYKAAGVRTTAIPYIQRPGKVPAILKTVASSSRTTPCKMRKDEKKGSGGSGSDSKVVQGPQSAVTGGVPKVLDTKTGEYVVKRTVWGGLSDKDIGKPVTNPAMIKDRPYIYSSEASKVAVGRGAADIQKVFNVIDGAFDAFKKAARADLVERQKTLGR